MGGAVPGVTPEEVIIVVEEKQVVRDTNRDVKAKPRWIEKERRLFDDDNRGGNGDSYGRRLVADADVQVNADI
jgi:hypothetical protein